MNNCVELELHKAREICEDLRQLKNLIGLLEITPELKEQIFGIIDDIKAILKEARLKE